MLRRLSVFVVGFLVVGTVTAAPAFAAAPTVTAVTPTSGGVGTSFTVTGTGFVGGPKVRINGVLATDLVVASATKLTARVPLTSSGAVTVTTPSGTATGPTFTVSAGVLLTPSVVRPSLPVAVTATGFAAGEAVDVYLDAAATGIAVSAPDGTVTTTVTPALATTPGSHWITAIGRRSGVATQAALTIRTDWNAPSFDGAHTGVNRFETQVTAATVGDLQQRWSTYQGTQVVAPPVVAGGLVVIHTGLDDVVATDAATGVQKWRVDLSTGVNAFSAPVVANGTVYVGATDGWFYALNLVNGNQKWRYDTGAGPVSDNPVVADNTVYVPTRSGALYALNATSGVLRWGNSPGGGSWFYSPTVAGAFLYVGASDQTVRRLSTSGGTGWVVDLAGSNNVPFAAPVVADGKVYVTTLAGTVFCFRAATGTSDWLASTGTGSTTSTPALVGGRLITSNTQGVVTAFDHVTGEVLWTQTGTKGGNSLVTAVNGTAFVSSPTRTNVYDVATGTVLRRLALGGNSAGVVVTDGAVYGYDATELWLTRFDLGPDRPTARPAPASLSPQG